MPELSGIHHVAITVSDAEASAAFYGRLLGLDEAFRIDDDTLCARVFAGDGFLFAVRHYKGHDKDPFSEFRTGMDHMAFAVPGPSCTGRLRSSGSTNWARPTPRRSRRRTVQLSYSAIPTAFRSSSTSRRTAPDRLRCVGQRHRAQTRLGSSFRPVAWPRPSGPTTATQPSDNHPRRNSTSSRTDPNGIRR